MMPRISKEERREREKERERERESAYRRVCISICTFSVTLSSLLFLSSHVGLFLSLSLCVCVYECGHVLVCCPLPIPSSSLPLSPSQTHTHTVEQSKIIAVNQLLDCSQDKNQKEPHTNPRMRVCSLELRHITRSTGDP